MSNSTVTPSLIVRAHAGQIHPGRGIVISPSRMDFGQNNRHHIDSRDAMCLSSHSTELQLCSTICRQSNWEVALFACGVPDTHSDMTGQTNQCAGRHVEPAKLDLSLSKKKLLANYTMRLVDGGAYIKGRDEGWHCVTWTMDDIWHSIRLTDSGEKRDRRQISPKYNTWRPSANSAGEYRIFLRKGDNNSTMARTSSCIMAAYSNPRKPIGFFSSFDGMSFVFCFFFPFAPLIFLCLVVACWGWSAYLYFSPSSPFFPSCRGTEIIKLSDESTARLISRVLLPFVPPNIPPLAQQWHRNQVKDQDVEMNRRTFFLFPQRRVYLCRQNNKTRRAWYFWLS